jgi:hypothetical protein
MLKGNQERLKMATKEGLVATGGKKFVWHLYVIPKVGPAMSFNWPRKLLTEVDNQIKATEYIVRESAEMGGKDDQLAIDSGPWGCKGYKQAAAAFLKDKHINVRTCSCEVDKEQAGVRKQRRTDLQDVNVRTRLGAPPAKQCQRFIKGICLLNKKGKKCSSSHDILDLWEISPNGKPVCKVKCELKPHATIKGACINGKDCLYMHADTTANRKK